MAATAATGSGAPAGGRRRRASPAPGRRRAAFELAQPGVEIDVQVALPLLRLLELVGQHFDLAAQLRDVGLDAARPRLNRSTSAWFFASSASRRVDSVCSSWSTRTLAIVVDALARLVVVEQRRAARAARRAASRTQCRRQRCPVEPRPRVYSPT